MNRTAAFFFAAWLLTAYMLVHALADIRHKADVIEGQRSLIEGAQSLARQVLESHNSRRSR